MSTPEMSPLSSQEAARAPTSPQATTIPHEGVTGAGLWLHVMIGGVPGPSVPLTTAALRVGTSPSCGLVVRDASMPSAAFTLAIMQGECWIEALVPLGVGGRPVSGVVRVHPHEVIQCGRCLFAIRPAGAPSPFQELAHAPAQDPRALARRDRWRVGLGTAAVLSATLLVMFALPYLVRALYPAAPVNALVGVSVACALVGLFVQHRTLGGLLRSENIPVAWGTVAIIVMLPGLLWLRDDLVWPVVTVYNPTDTSIEFTVDGAAPRPVASMRAARVTVSPTRHAIEFRAGGRRVDRVEGDAGTGDYNYLAVPLGFGCFTRQAVHYSVYSATQNATTTPVVTGQSWYSTASNYVIAQPPESITVDRRRGRVVLHWFRAVSCKDDEAPQPVALPVGAR